MNVECALKSIMNMHIVCSTYYNKNGYKRIIDFTYTPKKK